MKNMFLVHSVIEILAGIILIIRPSFLLMISGPELETIVVSKLYGVLALAFGSVCFVLYRMFNYSELYKKIALMIMFFHLMISFQMYAAFTQEVVSNLGAFGLHMILAVLFFGTYMNEINRFSKV